MAKRVVLAYSGGLYTSVAVHWLRAEHGYEVIRADDASVLLARSEFGPKLREAVSSLSAISSDTLDARLASRWLP